MHASFRLRRRNWLAADSNGADTVDEQLYGETVCRSNSFSINCYYGIIIIIHRVSYLHIQRAHIGGKWNVEVRAISNNINKNKVAFCHARRPKPLDHTRMKRANSGRLTTLPCTSHKAMVRGHECAEYVDCGIIIIK